MGRYLTLLYEVNQQFNLTAVTEIDLAWTRHIYDSLTLLPLLTGLDVSRCIDIGSGGGLPGLPLAITMPDVSFTLVEATGKKARFLEEAAAAVGATNVTVVCERAETIGQDRAAHREQYDVAMARAVGRLPVLLELTVPLVRPEGFVLAIKGAQAEAEIEEARRALQVLHTDVADLHRTATGTIIVLQKQRRTGKLYPRRPGEPKRAPLR